jgi:MYXO-CTERM domain-containing protein
MRVEFSRRLATFALVAAAVVPGAASAQTTSAEVSLLFTEGFLGTRANGGNGADNITTFQTARLKRAGFFQTDTDISNGISFSQQGNDILGTVKLFADCDNNGTVETQLELAAALTWRNNSGQTIEVLGFAFDTTQAVPSPTLCGTSLVLGTTDGVSTTLGLRNISSTLTFSDASNVGGDAAQAGLLTALNDALTASGQPSQIVATLGDSTVEGGTITYRVTLNQATTFLQAFPFTFGGTATRGTDYTFAFSFTGDDTGSCANNCVVDNGDGTITVQPGVGSFTVVVSTIDDANIEVTETVQLNVGPQSATGSITDNDTPPTIAISSSPTTVRAGETSTVTFTLSASSTNFALSDIGVFDAAGNPVLGTLTNFSGSGSVYTATFTPPPGSEDLYEIRVGAGTFTDGNGTANTTGDSEFITVDTLVPTIAINDIATDNVINAAEAAANVTVAGTTTNIENGRTVTVRINNVTYTTTVTNNLWSLSVPAADAALWDPTERVTADVSDLAGNPAPQATRDITVDKVAPSITINPISTDDIINAAEAGAAVTVSGTTTGVEDGRTLTVQIDGQSYTATVNNNSWSINVPPADIAAFEASEDVTANVSDAAGNPAVQATRTITVDTTPPTIAINVIAADDKINATEAQSTVTIAGTATGADGRTVTVTVDGVDFTATVSGGTWSITVPVTNIAAFEASELVTARVSDAAGNEATATRTVTVVQPFTTGPLDITTPTDSGADDDLTNNNNPAMTFTGPAGLTITLRGADGALLDPAAYTVVETPGTNGQATYTVTLKDADPATAGNQPFGDFAGGVATNNPANTSDGLYSVIATDNAGNAVNVGDIEIDTTAPGAGGTPLGPIDITTPTDSGPNDAVTDNNNPVVTFTGEPGLDIVLFGPDGEALDPASYTVVETPNATAGGPSTYTVTLKDADPATAGNQPFGDFDDGEPTGNDPREGDGQYDIVAIDDAANEFDVGSFEINTDPCADPNGPLCDQDGDGLTNAEEDTIGTEKTDPDTDGDGIKDGAERGVDVNGDPIPNATVTDPKDADTDGDGLCDGNNAIFNVCTAGEDRDNDGVVDTGESDPSDPCDPDTTVLACDTGDRDGDGTPNGTDPDDTDPCIPNNTAGNCDRDNDGLTNSEEQAIGTDGGNADTDGDGINDGAEDDAGTDPNDECDPTPNEPSCDADNDGKSNADEQAAGTDPQNPDTDGDGESDGAEGGTDTDGDGIDDALDSDDLDDDGDGVVNELDVDNGDPCIPSVDAPTCDQDGDGLANSGDNCPTNTNADQSSTLGGAGGDACTPTVLSGGGLVNCAQSSGGGTASMAALLGLVGLLGRRRRRRAAAPVVAASAALLAQGAQAATIDVPADTFRPAMDANGIIDVDSAQTTGHLAMDGGLFLDYQLNPLVLNTVNPDGTLSRALPVVAHRVGGNLVAALGLFDWFQLGVDLPVVLFQTRDTATVPALGDIAINALQVTGLGDLRLRPKFQILRAKSAFVDLAVLPTLTLPTHTAAGSFLGDSSFTLVPEVVVSRAIGDLRFATNVGVRLRGQSGALADINIGNELTYRGGVAYRFGSLPLEVGGSFTGAAGLTTPFTKSTENPLEVLAGVGWYPTSFLKVSAGGGVGVINGFGVPDARLYAGVQFINHDRDGDGIPDGSDQCVDDPEDLDSYADGDGCPDPDNDADGVLDVNDGAPNDPEDKDGFNDGDGVPDPDNDGDGIKDADDKCVDVPGDARFGGCPPPDADKDGILDPDDACPAVPGLAAFAGCPDKDGDGITDANDKCPDVKGLDTFFGCPDTDGDGFEDSKDACPTQPETKNGVADDDGCPDTDKSKVSITKEQIMILEQVLFDTNKATIRKESFDLLDQVAKVFLEHPEIKKVLVEGHTDDVGKDDANLKLSDNRAKAVVAYLTKKGVEAARLDAKGFGETKPVVPNDSKENRQKNRRVVFSIIDPAPAK